MVLWSCVPQSKRGAKKRASLLPGLGSPQVMGALLRHRSGKGTQPGQHKAKGENEAT